MRTRDLSQRVIRGEELMTGLGRSKVGCKSWNRGGGMAMLFLKKSFACWLPQGYSLLSMGLIPLNSERVVEMWPRNGTQFHQIPLSLSVSW